MGVGVSTVGPLVGTSSTRWLRWRSGLAGKLRVVAALSLIAVSLLSGVAAIGGWHVTLAARQTVQRHADAASGVEAIRAMIQNLRVSVLFAQQPGAAQVPDYLRQISELDNALHAPTADWGPTSNDLRKKLAAAVPELSASGHQSIITPTASTRARFQALADQAEATRQSWQAAGLAELAAQDQAEQGRIQSFLLYLGLGCAFTWLVCFLAMALVDGALRRLGQITIAMLRLAHADTVPSLPSLDDADEIGDMARAIAIFRDVMIEATRRGAQLETANRMLDAALNNMSQGLVMLDSQQRLLISNRQYRALFGLPADLLYPGMSAQEMLALSRAAGNFGDRDPTEVETYIADWLTSGRPHMEQITVGSGRLVTIRRMPMADGGWVCTYEDVTERTRTVARIAHMDRHDILTDLANRRALLDMLQHSDAMNRPREGYAIHCINLDRFKVVNETLGYVVGDRVLCEVAKRLRSIVRENDIPARLGSDEFAVVQGDGDTAEKVSALANRLIAQLSKPYEIDGTAMTIGASVGIAFADARDTDAERLLRNADLALLHAKQAGGGTWRLFEAEMDAAAQSRRKLEQDLRVALQNNEFELYYQPLIAVMQRKVTSFEALLRWRHPTVGMIAPDQFIPLAEELGLIVPIGEWVLRTACAEAASWPTPVRVAVNLSPIQFGHRTATGGIADQVEAALRDTGLPANRLELEITESVLLQESDPTSAALHRLRALGVRISLDDFGTGYSSLRYLRSFPFDKIKIDKSFVRGLGESDEADAIVRAITGLGSSLGISTTAEGVETLQQLEQLIVDGCTEVQGYFFSPPRPAAEVPRLLTEAAVRRAA